MIEKIADILGTKLGKAQKAIAWLQHYGYLAGSILDQASNVVVALQRAQASGGLKPTGILDTETLSLLGRPRCGCVDVQRVSLTGEQARWRKSDLTYTVETYVGGLSPADQEDLIAQAFAAWSALANIRVRRTDSRAGADIVISTGRGPAQQFDGPSGTLAWAYMPTGTDQKLLMRFDLDETWIRQGNAGILYLNVATHEFGHLLGLEHSRVSTALMAPFYSPSITRPQENDDIPRIQALYGPSTPTPPPVNPPTPTPTKRIVIEGNFVVREG